MTRTASAELLAHLEQQETTTCRLLKITTLDGTVYGMTNHDQDITYESVVYYATNGFDPSDLAADIGLSVDNSECQILSAEAAGITVEMVMVGVLDDAQWILYLINWSDLTMGHMVIDAGDVGEVKVIDDVLFMPELLSYAMRLRQPIGHVWQRDCRAIFGTAAASQTGCGVDVTGLWISCTITGISATEPQRIFADSVLAASSAPIAVVPGRVQWLTGNNTASRLYQVESYDEVTGTIALLEPTPYDIVIGDTFKIRPDCDKTVETCEAYSNFVNFKGEPLIPVADGTSITTPGAQI